MKTTRFCEFGVVLKWFFTRQKTVSIQLIDGIKTTFSDWNAKPEYYVDTIKYQSILSDNPDFYEFGLSAMVMSGRGQELRQNKFTG